ncbi:MAG: hypothetical protein JXB49_22545 [Bacteroidales bacterium]|nr:hypothetical protein [Bacteroidales bacterium]
MKIIKWLLLFTTTCFIPSNVILAQQPDTTLPEKTLSIVIKNDGARYIGVIVFQDAREILIETEALGEIYIPKHEIKEIRELKEDEINDKKQFLTEEIFATRYFITTNGLPVEKGESYIQWNWFGPDFQFGVHKNFGFGIMTTWVGIPIIGSAKYSLHLGEKANLGIGTLLGTGSWANPEFGIALPFSAFTIGNRRNNINLSAGYGGVWTGGDGKGGFLTSLAGMTKVSNSISIVFDSFVLIDKTDYFALLIPGIRFQTESNKAFQFGFGGIIQNDELLEVPIPLVQWYRKI